MQALISQEKNRDLIHFADDDVRLIRDTIARDANESEFKLFLYQCRKTGLDPLAKQIYFQKRGGKMVIITGIDGYRLTADRTGKCAGNDDPIFDDEKNPAKATVTVYKIVDGIRCPYTASARWEQYYPGDAAGQMWRKMPHLMLGKCAEALALRKAFPAELSGVYVREEMEQADHDPEPKMEPKNVTPPRPKASAASPFDVKIPGHKTIIESILKREKVDSNVWPDILAKLQGRPFTELRAVTEEVFSALTGDDFEIPFESGGAPQ